MEKIAISFLGLLFLVHSPLASADLPAWSYDAGPDLSTPMGRELVDLNASIPDFPSLSTTVIGEQKFRPAFGPIPWRMLQKPNSVKILFIGQDGTHIAEAAGRPATAGFGGRAQDLAKYFGVSASAAFINTFAFTIKGQYGAFSMPQVRYDQSGKVKSISSGSFVNNPLWLVSQDLDSPLVKWRNGLIDWIIRNNKDSLQLIVLFGGAARDAAAGYVISKGGSVETRVDSDSLSKLRIPETEMVSAGGNNETPVPYTTTGEDIYEKVLGKKPNYKTPQNATVNPDMEQIFDLLSKDVSWSEKMVFSEGGLNGSGVLHPAQLSGYDIAKKMVIQGRTGISLKGLKISNDVTIDHDILVVQLPHPTALSTMKPAVAAQKVGEALEAFKPYVAQGWKIEPDEESSLVNNFAAGKTYAYARADMGPEYYDFGAPASRMVNVSTASRLNPNTIVFGTRDHVNFDDAKLKEMTFAKPSQYPDAGEMWTARPRLPESRDVFDAGPGEKYAKIMKENLSEDLIAAHRVNRDFGHYRGTFQKPKVLIIADPAGYDDLITARALTGTRGQYLHGLMKDLGVGHEYLVIKTAPFGMDAENMEDWNGIVEKTKTYREKLLTEILKDGTPQLILADGEFAQKEVSRILNKTSISVITISRSGKANDSAEMIDAVSRIAKAVPAFKGSKASGKMSDIPRVHLSYYARLWEGTSGDRVITSNDPKYRGVAFAEVAPRWATTQKASLSFTEKRGAQILVDKLKKAGLRLGGESISDFVSRVHPEQRTGTGH